MEVEPTCAGFEELAHTADVAVKVWGRDREELFHQAALSLYHIMGIATSHQMATKKQIHLADLDVESLLVSFLSNLLVAAENGIAFDHFAIAIIDTTLEASLTGSRIIKQEREVKAVTYHDLKIEKQENRFEVVIVFDV